MRVVILAPQGVQSLDVVGPAEVFWEAARRLGDPDAYQVQVMGISNEPIRGTGALRFLPDRTISDPDEPIDTLFVAGDPSFQEVAPEVSDWIARRAPESRRYASICTGAFLLAQAGLLDGRVVTTHWECADKLRDEFPHLKVDSDQIFIRDGQLSTAAGVTSGIDLALAFVEEDHGRDIALIVARYMVVFLKRPGGQSQFSAHLTAQIADKGPIQSIVDYVLSDLRSDLSVEALAARAKMSTRKFSRVFVRDIGATPADFVEAARLDAARRLLQDSSMPLQRVADRCGFDDVHKMRRVFQRTLGVGPTDYRATFQTSLPTPKRSRAAQPSAPTSHAASSGELPVAR
jgi:transcriptional regulator GlxA family with amidase domain